MAVPVSGKEVARGIKGLVDDLVVLEKPAFFCAVAQVYEEWHDVSDQEALEIMGKWGSR